jgi:hypothetical protein
MRILLVWALSLGFVSGADFSFDIRETTIVNPIFGMKTKENVAHVAIQGGSVAIRQNDIVQVSNGDLNQITLIDYRTRTFATSNLDELERAGDHGFDSIQQNSKSELVISAQPSVWNGIAVKRDVARMVLTGGEAPGEVRVTSDWIESDPAGFAESRHALESAEEHHQQDIQTELHTLVFEHPGAFADALSIRKNAKGANSFQVHSLEEMRLAADAPILQTIAPEYRDRPVMSRETEVIGLNAGNVDPGAFLVPSGFTKVEFSDLLREKYVREHY